MKTKINYLLMFLLPIISTAQELDKQRFGTPGGNPRPAASINQYLIILIFVGLCIIIYYINIFTHNNKI